MTIMYNGQHSPDAKIEKSHRCQESRQFTVSGKVKYIQRHSYCQQEKACEYPGRSSLSSHPAATPSSDTKTRLSSENTRFKMERRYCARPKSFVRCLTANINLINAAVIASAPAIALSGIRLCDACQAGRFSALRAGSRSQRTPALQIRYVTKSTPCGSILNVAQRAGRL